MNGIVCGSSLELDLFNGLTNFPKGHFRKIGVWTSIRVTVPWLKSNSGSQVALTISDFPRI